MEDNAIKEKKTAKVEEVKALPKVNSKTVKKIGSVPFGYTDDDVVYIENGKIYIAKPSK
jgi:hypothetical protein